MPPTPDDPTKVICFPDFEGKKAIEFGDTLARLYPDTMIVPVLNGPDHPALLELHDQIREKRPAFESVVVRGQGLLAATWEAYRILALECPNATLVKLDTGEHDITYIGRLADRAQKIGGFVVGDLEFTEATLVPGTPDYHAHMHVFPAMYGNATNGALPLTCAHGFQAFGPGVLAQVLHGIELIFAEVQRMTGSLPQWGLDGTAALAAYKMRLAVDRLLVPAMQKRNRPKDKVDAQTAAHKTICLAARQAFKH